MRGIDFASPTRPSRLARRSAVALTALAVGAGGIGGLGGCGSSAPSTAAATSEPDLGVVEEGVRNQQDVAFVREMILHHRTSVALARLAEGRTENARVRALAQRVETAATPETEQLTRWATAWGQPVPAVTAAGRPVTGTASAPGLAALTAAKGADFDRRFLTVLIAHQERAVAQAQGQLKSGADERVKGLAADIAAAGEADVAEMKTLLR